MTTVSINSKEGKTYSSQKVPISNILKLHDSFVDMAKTLGNELGVLIQFNHHQPTSLLHLTDVYPYALLFFDEALSFKGATYSIKSGTGSFAIQTQYKNILFLRVPHNLKLSTITNLKF